MNVTAKNRTPSIDEVISFLSYTALEKLSELTSNNSLYNLRDAWPYLDKFRFQRCRLLLVFATLPESFTEALNIARLQKQQVGVMELDEYGDLMMRPDLQPASKECVSNPSLLFFATERAEPKMGLK